MMPQGDLRQSVAVVWFSYGGTLTLKLRKSIFRPSSARAIDNVMLTDPQ